jgi:hypothetical protein
VPTETVQVVHGFGYFRCFSQRTSLPVDREGVKIRVNNVLVLFFSVCYRIAMSTSPHDFPQPENPRTACLSAVITCRIEIRCNKGTVDYPVRLMLRLDPDRTLGDAVDRLRCSRSQGKP